MAMGTTLVTFFFDCPVPASKVELLGSWDNFNTSYHLKLDRRRGPTFWSGCFTFRDIICDGDPSNPVPKRDGALKEGGTYWYYYKVNDEEYHNTRLPSTTFCPLYPGQHLNVLEIPMESMTGAGAQAPDVFTRDPDSRYLTPTPPKPLRPSRLGDLCKQPLSDSSHPSGPRSATYPPSTRLLSPPDHQRSRSASTSPSLGSAASFLDLRSLREKTAALKRSASPNRARSNTRELQIGSPILISTTAEDIPVMPLSSHASKPSPPSYVMAQMKQFSALGSHPVDPCKDLDDVYYEEARRPSTKRPRSHASTPSVRYSAGRIRANSSETRRTRQYKLYSNEPWVSSPKLGSCATMATAPAPVSQRPLLDTRTTSDQRPASRRSDQVPRTSIDKSLPPLPQYLVPAPLSLCNKSTPTSPIEQSNTAVPLEVETIATEAHVKRRSQRSHWSLDSVESMAFSSPSSNNDEIYSPTFSTFTTNSSQAVSPQRESFIVADDTHNYCSLSEIEERQEGESDPSYSASPEKETNNSSVPRLSVSSVIPKLFDMELRHTEFMPRRHAACFGFLDTPGSGLGIQPSTTSPALNVNIPSSPLFPVDNKHASSVSQLERLVSEFGFLGQAVH